MTTQTKSMIELPDFLTVRELANKMGVSPIEVIKELMNNGIMANINQQIDFDTAAIVAEEMGFDATPIAKEIEEEEDAAERPAWRKVLAEEREVDLKARPPVITMLGHVDHGKTSLLDSIRHANVAGGESGGITQHIGAYQARHNNQLITFLDTPGHEAFTAMRARGAQVTDIAVLVVAADDGVMPQTREAVDHARAAGVPIIVALNKVDLPNANTPRVMQQLAEIGLNPLEWDGETMVVPVSAKPGAAKGIDDLLEAINLTAEELNPRANPKATPIGSVIEARVERGRGATVTLLIQNGTLKLGDTLLIGKFYGRIKAMFDYTGKRIKEAGPSTPVSVSGLNGIPGAGEQFRCVENEKVARKIIADKELEESHQVGDGRRAVSLDDFFFRLQEGETKPLNLIVKADVQGSLEPVVNSLEKLSGEEVKVEILRAATGNVTESDIMLAAASDAIVLGFNVEVDVPARVTASNEQVEIKVYSIIYKLIEDVEKALKGMLAPTFEEIVIGRAEVRETFRIKGVGTIAGSYMRTGEGRRNSKARVIRDGKLLYSSNVTSLKHLQENVREVKTGFEFGVSLENWQDYEVGDIIEFFTVKRSST
jgi:translation initiation factor IF-2